MAMCVNSHQEELENGHKRDESSALQKIGNCCFPQTKSQPIYRYNFYLCQWQLDQDVSILYLIYRWLSAIWFLAVLSCSLLDIGRSDDSRFENHYAKWWIDLTNWALAICAVQAWLGAMIVTQGLMIDRDDFGMQRDVKKSCIHHAYWVLYTIATVYSFTITFSFWTIFHDPDEEKLDAINLMVYVFNSAIMLIDLMTVTHPIILGHSYWTIGMGLAYTMFTAIYYMVGGTSRTQSRTIYRLLDWSKPGKSIVVSVLCIAVVFLIHFSVYILYRCRVCLFTKFCIRQRPFQAYHSRYLDQMILSNSKAPKMSRTPSSYDESKQEQFFNNPHTSVDFK